MPLRLRDIIDDCYDRLLPVLSGPPMLAFLPALMLAGYWLVGELALVGLALGFPLVLGAFGLARRAEGHGLLTERRLRNCDSFETLLDHMVQVASHSGRRTGCLLIIPDEAAALRTRLGDADYSDLLQQMHDRVAGALRGRDQLRRLGDDRLAVALAPVQRLSQGNALHMANRLQAALELPFPTRDGPQRIYVAVGLALASDVGEPGGGALLDAADQALTQARKHPPGALRIYASENSRNTDVIPMQISDILAGLDRNEFLPWFQPQISTDTGRISGLEALARWDRGPGTPLPPAGFIAALNKAGQIPRLDDQIQTRALAQLRTWRASGLDIPQLSLNLSAQTLGQPGLVERLEWSFDQHGLEPCDICLDVPFALLTKDEGSGWQANLTRLAQLGCQLDLDDFSGEDLTLPPALDTRISRLKLSANITRNIAKDTASQRRLTTLIEKCDPRGIDILAKGVETPEDHAILAQLGCRHIQGFVVGAPMPAADCAKWVAAHEASPSTLPPVGRLG
ncbi:EAL domain-containing protein [Roseovarius sp. C7]|uniref:EAL domain-containing protein n=1 Tax=Roseovarius sp. C7 TaxID=3398643 RepID=UPI0039F6D583